LTIINYNNLVNYYIIIIRVKRKELKRIGVDFSKWLYISILLYSLDDKYKEFVYRTITTLVKKTNLDFKIVTA